MTGYRTLSFNAWIWIQTTIVWYFSKSIGYIPKFLGFRVEDPNSPAWIQQLLRKKFARLPPISSIHKSEQILKGGGLSGYLYKIEVKYCNRNSPAGYPRSLVVKQGKSGFRSRLQIVFSGSAREAIFYSNFAPKHPILASCVPEIYYSRGSLLTGEYIIVMEDLTAESVPSGHLLGNQCWGDEPVPMELEILGMYEVLRTIFVKMAEIHARFWRDEALLKNDWMKGSTWLKRGGKLGWEVAMDNTRTRWGRVADSTIFTTLQRSTFQNLLDQTSWSGWHRATDITSSETPYTLTHGDFHANNVLFRIDESQSRAMFVDWAMVGVGCPFTELAQFMISNAPCEFRRANERQLFDEYYVRLVQLGVDSKQFPVDKCWEKYKAGGIERWLQLLVLLVLAGLPEFSLQWFSRQVESFLQDHLSSVPNCLQTLYMFPL